MTTKTQKIDDFTLILPSGFNYRSHTKILEILEFQDGVVVLVDVNALPWPPKDQIELSNIIKVSLDGKQVWRLDPPIKDGDYFGKIIFGDSVETFKAISGSGFCLVVNYTDGKVIEKIWTK